METIISGLLIQKPGSPPPKPGDERWFSWEERKGQSGKPYIKIKNESKEYGGKLCSIIDAEKTDFQDKHGNVSYNVGFEPVIEGHAESASPRMLGRAGGGPITEDFIPMTHDAKGVALPGVDEAKHHIMQSVNLYTLCVDAVDTVIKPHVEGMTAEMYQAAVGTLFIEASRTGFVAKMPQHPIPAKKTIPGASSKETEPF